MATHRRPPPHRSGRFRRPSAPLFLFFASASLTAQTAAAFALRMSSSSAASSAGPTVIDSHLHVWASSDESKRYPYAPGQTPPAVMSDASRARTGIQHDALLSRPLPGSHRDNLIDRASTDSLLSTMDEAGIDGALIVQPINHKFDHSYVSDAIQAHPDKFKGILLHDPSLSPADAVSRLEELALKGFVGVRFNPYLFPDGKLMSEPNGAGLAVYKRCAELHMPVGVMCFKGLGLHYDDIVSLIKASPDTTLILDHFGFTRLDEEGDEAFNAQLLSLAQYPNVVVKVSALFRIAGPGNDPFPHDEVKRKRFLPLLEMFGPDQLMFGTDFPFVLKEEGGYQGALEVVRSWTEEGPQRHAILGGTACRLFGEWGKHSKVPEL